ncbi:hypothetical protein [Thermomonospora umbrina]|uniref:hypothetical protein n=1 Tax=Thermomonospora umbrina TaxID=111806 RepID=UPI000E24E94B|nr:hypothetical protein [Thermomonospora umbrina]
MPWLYGIATNLMGRHRRAEVSLDRVVGAGGPAGGNVPSSTAGIRTEYVDAMPPVAPGIVPGGCER